MATSHDLTADVMVRMRDGVHLATDVYRPVDAGAAVTEPRPTVLVRTPYDKRFLEGSFGWAERFAEHGYVAVVQDCRGCYGSEGEVDFLWPEADDGHDTMAWIVDQPWCDGRIATWGVSWSGWTQTAAAVTGAPGLAAMIPTMSGARAHETTVRHGGTLELRFVAWAFWHSALNERADRPEWVTAALNLAAPTMGDWLTALPLRRGVTQLSLVPEYERWALDLATRGDFDERWRHPSVDPVGHVDAAPAVPTLFVGGWYDSYTRASFQLWDAFRDRGAPTHLLIGPWVHGGRAMETTYAGDVEFGLDAALASFLDVHLDWFDHWLRGEDHGFDDAAAIRLFVMGGGGGHRAANGRLFHGGEWRDEHEWPLARTRWEQLHLHGDGTLRPKPEPADEVSTTYLFNPADPVPTIGGNMSSFADLGPLPPGVADPRFAAQAQLRSDLVAPGGFDQVERPDVYGCESPYLPLSARADVVSFSTDPLPDDVEVTGPVRVVLWVSSTAPDTDFTAKLIDVYPPSPWYPYGYALNLTDSTLRLRYRRGPSAAAYEPGEVVPIEIELYPTSNLFAAGHRIRLDVSSSNFPRFDVNPNTGDPLWTERVRRTAENTIHHDRSHPSHVVLPVIPGPGSSQ